MPLEEHGGITRWTPAGAMLGVSLISYIDRNTLALLAPTILRETGLTGEQYGFIIAAFSIAYCVANPVWGTILDRAGLRRGMMAADPDASVSCPSRTISFSRRISDQWPPSEGSRRATRSLIEFEPTSIAAMFFAAILDRLDRIVALLS